MKRFLLALLLISPVALFSGLNPNKNLSVKYASYIVSEHEVRQLDEGLIHRTTFGWTLESHPELLKFIKQYDKIKTFEIFIKNDCSKICQLIVFTFKDGTKKKIMVDNFLVYTELDPASPHGYAVKKSGPFAPDHVLARYKLISSDDIMVASKSW